MPSKGDRKTTVTTITNAQLGAVGFFGGSATSSAKKAMKTLAEKQIKTQVTKVVGSAVIPGIGYAMWATTAVGYINGALGKSGFKITLTLEYKEFFFNQQGHYVRGWDIVNVKVTRY
ncbi:MAG: hypothetical protein RSD47_06565 [Romboutsia sp.]